MREHCSSSGLLLKTSGIRETHSRPLPKCHGYGWFAASTMARRHWETTTNGSSAFRDRHWSKMSYHGCM